MRSCVTCHHSLFWHSDGFCNYQNCICPEKRRRRRPYYVRQMQLAIQRNRDLASMLKALRDRGPAYREPARYAEAYRRAWDLRWARFVNDFTRESESVMTASANRQKFLQAKGLREAVEKRARELAAGAELLPEAKRFHRRDDGRGRDRKRWQKTDGDAADSWLDWHQSLGLDDDMD